MKIWLKTSDSKVATNWYNFGANFIPSIILLEDENECSLEIITLTEKQLNEIMEFAKDPTMKRIFPDIIEEASAHHDKLEQAFNIAISQNYIVVSDEQYAKVIRRFIILNYEICANGDDFLDFFDIECFSDHFLNKVRDYYYDFIDKRIFLTEQPTKEGKMFIKIFKEMNE